jgi:4-amino-4-deoxy-L-arabinose transferase-like glycosyltransferase
VRRVPLSLAVLLAVAVIQAVTWSLVIPALQGPDEVAHFTYTQLIVEKGGIPWRPGGLGKELDPFTREVGNAQVNAGLLPLAGNLGARPLWTSADVALWSRRDAALPDSARSVGGTSATSLKNPPVYYLYEAVPYAVARGGSFFDREMVMRLANIPLLLIALTFVWLVAGELFGRRSDQVLATATAALVPQLTNVTATINPDALLIAEWSAAIWLMILILRRGLQFRLLLWLAAVVVLAGFTHGRSLPLLLPVVLTLAIAFGRDRGWRPLRIAAAFGAAYVLIILVASTWGQGSLREFASYVWQFYLPKLGFMNPSIGPPDYGFRRAFTERLYGTLAQLEVVLPHTLGTWMLWLTVLGLIALVVALVLQRDAVRRNAPIAIVLGATIIALLLGLHLAAYRSMLTSPGDPIITARYLLPLLPLFGAAIVIVARALPRTGAAVFAGLVLAGGVALQFVSLGLLWERFYA